MDATDAVRRASVRISKMITSTHWDLLFDGSRILSCTWTEEAAMLGLTRRLGDLTLRISNGFGDGSGDRAGWRGPSMSAVLAEDPDDLLGITVEVALGFGDGSYTSIGPHYRIDSVQATDSEVTVHATSIDSCFDRTLDELGIQTALTASTRPVTWVKDAMAAAGWTRSKINYSGNNPQLGSACTLDGSMTVAQASSGLLAYLGLGYSVYTDDIYITDMSGSYQQRWTGAFGWPVPLDTERYGTLSVKDPSTGTVRYVTLNPDLEKTLDVTVPLSSGMDLTKLTAWAKLRYADTLYTVTVPGAGATWVSRPNISVPVARWTSEGRTRQQLMIAQKVEHRFDGGYTETITGTLGNVVNVIT